MVVVSAILIIAINDFVLNARAAQVVHVYGSTTYSKSGTTITSVSKAIYDKSKEIDYYIF